MVHVYDLINANGDRFSPFAWRTLMALKHKGIDFELTGLTFLQVNDQIPKLSNEKWDKVPLVVIDDNTVVYDSAPIAEYLETNYPENPLFPNGKAHSTFITSYTMSNFQALFQLVCMSIYNSISEEDKVYFRKSREGWFQTTLENFTSQTESYYVAVEKLLLPFRVTLKENRYLEGDKPTYSDYVLFGAMMLVNATNKSVFERLFTNHEDPTLINFFEDVASLYDGFAKKFVK